MSNRVCINVYKGFKLTNHLTGSVAI